MLKYKIDTYTFDVPTCWEEVTLGQWLGLQKVNAEDACAILEIITGVAKSVWLNTSEIDVVEKLLPALAYLSDNRYDADYFNQLPRPEVVTIDGQEYKVPNDITTQTFGQMITFETQLQKHIRDNNSISVDFYPIAIAIYLWSKRPFIDTEALAFAEKVRTMPVVQAIPIGNFFLSSFVASRKLNATALLVSMTKSK